MSYQGLSDNIEIEEEYVLPTVQDIATLVRDELLKDVRRKGTLFGPKYAQKRTPLIAKKAPPQSQRIW